MSDERQTCIFLYGADMDPSLVRTTWPGGRFVARAWVTRAVTLLPPLPETEAPPPLPGAAVAPPEAVWGILIRPASDRPLPAPAETVEAVTDDGRRFAAVVRTEAAALAEPPAVVAAARYWELPPAYVRRLTAWAEHA